MPASSGTLSTAIDLPQSDSSTAARRGAMILLIDNYDSFVHNLARYLEELGQATVVRRNDATSLAEITKVAVSAIVISPGPCGPKQAGISLPVVTELAGKVPILGACLGHQCIGEAFGGRVVRAPEPVHGRTSAILHDGRGIFAGLPQPLTATRYHSLVVSEEGLPDCLEVTARTEDGIVMALQHRQLPVVGVQFHPESILTQRGHRLLANFLRLAGVANPPEPAGEETELASATVKCRHTPGGEGVPEPLTW